MHIHFSSAMAVVFGIKFVLSLVYQLSLVFCFKLAICHNWSGLVHRPILNWGLLFLVVVISVGSASVWIKVVAIWMKIVPSCDISSLYKLSFVICSIGAIGFMRETHRMFVEGCNWHHFFVLSRIRIFVLSYKIITA